MCKKEFACRKWEDYMLKELANSCKTCSLKWIMPQQSNSPLVTIFIYNPYCLPSWQLFGGLHISPCWRNSGEIPGCRAESGGWEDGWQAQSFSSRLGRAKGAIGCWSRGEPMATAASTPHRLGTGSAGTLGAAKPNLPGASRGWQPHSKHLEVRLHLEVIEEDPH